MGETPSMDRGMNMPNPEDEGNNRADANPNREGNEWVETVERYENGEIRKVTKTRDNPAENSTDIVTSEYDEKGRLIMRELNDDERCESTRNVYDENGRVIEKRNHNERYGDSVMTDFIYDESGEPVSCIVYDLEGLGSEKEAKGSRTTARFDKTSKTWQYGRNNKDVEPNARALI